MAENLENRVDRIEGKLDALAVSVDARFDQVTAAFIEQRGYTDSAFERLDARLTRVEGLIPAVSRLEDGMGRIERKLDGFIDAQTKTNELVERRLLRRERTADDA